MDAATPLLDSLFELTADCRISAARLRKIGSAPQAQGGFADVWLGELEAEYNGGSKLVAIKELRNGLQQHTSDRMAKRLFREILQWIKFKHPNLVSLYGYTFENGIARLITPWYKNGSLPRFLELHPKVDKVGVILDVARGLEYLHTLPSPVVHGDIKGANVLVDDDGCAKIGDFGLAKSTEEIITGLTTMDVPLGSIPWLAPELINESSPYHTTASDVWAFGYLALEVLTGKRPFFGITDPRVIIAYIATNKRTSKQEYGMFDREDEWWPILETCWAADRLERASMTNIQRQIINLSMEVTSSKMEILRTWSTPVFPLQQERIHQFSGRVDALSGGRAGVMETYTEALSIRSMLDSRHPLKVKALTASSLHKLAFSLEKQGEIEKAAWATGEAASIRRELHQLQSSVYKVDLATSLFNHSVYLEKLKLYSDASRTIDEVKPLFQELATAQPGKFQPRLATAFHSNGVYMEMVGDFTKASEEMRQAVIYRRELASKNPASHRTELVQSLYNLGVYLEKQRDFKEAAEVAGEAIVVLRQLAISEPDSYQPKLASTLHNRAVYLEMSKVITEASELMAEAVAIRTVLALHNPARFKADLSHSLYNYGVYLGKLGRQRDALDVLRQAVENYRELIKRQPDVYRPKLVRSLETLGVCLRKLGLSGEAGVVYEEAMSARKPGKYAFTAYT